MTGGVDAGVGDRLEWGCERMGACGVDSSSRDNPGVTGTGPGGAGRTEK